MPGYDNSIADVVRSTIHDAQELVRNEIALAKAEMREEVKRTGAGVAALTAAAVAALIGVVFLLTAAAWAIAAGLGWPVWTGFALVGVAVAIVAAALAAAGRKRFNGQPPLHLTMQTMKENMRWLRVQRS